MTENPVFGRIAGTAGVIIVIALMMLGMRLRFAAPAGSIEVTVPMSETGIGMTPGTTVKVLGVTIGEVVAIELSDDGTPVSTVRINPGFDVPSENLEVVISPKTFFGEKQLLFQYPLEQFGQPPFIQDGDVLGAARALTEVEDVLNSIQPVLDAVDEQDIATLFDAAADFEGEGDNFARGLEVGAELSEFGVDTAEDTLRNARILTSLANQLATSASDFDRLNRLLPASVALLVERTAEIETNLEALSQFSLTLALYIDVEEDRFDALLASGDLVGAFFDDNVESIPSILEGLRLFSEVQARPSPFLEDGGIYAPFKAFLDLESELGPLGPILSQLTGSGGSN